MEMYCVVENRHGLRWSNIDGWVSRPFDIFVGLNWNLPQPDGKWVPLTDDVFEKDQTKNIHLRGHQWNLPMVLPFWTGASGTIKKDWSFYDVVDFRNPKKGEFYLSGSPVGVWVAKEDLKGPYLVVVPTKKAIHFSGWRMEND